jgi:catechol 2,3-dioxygenase-like lactoylglutathione lyase family enzyme
MSEASFRLQHPNMPARDPEGLARWYASTFDLQADGNRVRGPGVLIAFQPGEPVNRAPELHIGFLVPSLAELTQRADRLGGALKTGSEFTTFQVRDPEGNCVEIYCNTETD